MSRVLGQFPILKQPALSCCFPGVSWYICTNVGILVHHVSERNILHLPGPDYRGHRTFQGGGGAVLGLFSCTFLGNQDPSAGCLPSEEGWQPPLTTKVLALNYVQMSLSPPFHHPACPAQTAHWNNNLEITRFLEQRTARGSSNFFLGTQASGNYPGNLGGLQNSSLQTTRAR